MQVDPVLRNRVEADSRLLNALAAASAFPSSASLSAALRSITPRRSKKASPTRNITPDTAKLFTTAAINMWMRAVHSFLISASLTNVSPNWASVTGYYSSHYSIRAIAHFLGFFRLYNGKRMVRVELSAGQHVCTFDPNPGREHQIYWAIVKTDLHFATDPFFTRINSDVDHRDWAQYADHLPQFPPFRPLDKETLKARIDRLSEIPFASPPIPEVSKYPDLDSVQIIAYHRLIRFRDLVDAIFAGKNKLWQIYRNPNWATEFMDFQIVEGRTLHSEFTL